VAILTVESIQSAGAVAVFRVRSSDGGRFFVLVDRWGNSDDLGCSGFESESFGNPELLAKVARMQGDAS
jgi:hypothetical protein